MVTSVHAKSAYKNSANLSKHLCQGGGRLKLSYFSVGSIDFENYFFLFTLKTSRKRLKINENACADEFSVAKSS